MFSARFTNLPLLQSVLLALPVAACQPTVNVEEASAVLLDVDRAWAAAVASGASVDSIVSFWTDDARIISPSEPIVAGKDSLRAMVMRAMASGARISWTPERAVVSKSGDLGYTVGTNQFVIPDSAGQLMTITGRYVSVWRKEADLRWRCVEDIHNPGPP